MQRCQSMATMPSSRFQVAWVGHTRTHGGLSQWLQKTITGCLPIWTYGSDSRKGCAKGSFQIQGTFWVRVREPSSSAHLAMSMAMPQRVGLTADASLRAAQRMVPRRKVFLEIIAHPL